MDKSILHIKAPHELHIAAKVFAIKQGKSMNQYVVDLIRADVGEADLAAIEVGIKVYREDKPKTPTEVIDGAKRAMTVLNEPEKILEKIKKTAAGKPNLCKQHGTPLDSRGRCMIKGCKYS